MSNFDSWLKKPFDEKTQYEVKELINNPIDLKDSFIKNLEFGTGGMRGIMGVGSNRINKYTIGKNTQGISNYLNRIYNNKKIKTVVGYDSRNNSEKLAKIVADIFTANGIHCFLFSELRPTPELSFAVRYLNAHCGIVITASHNPPEYNGYKVYGIDGGQIVPPEDKLIIEEINKINYNDILFESNPLNLTFIDSEIDNEYFKTVLSLAKYSKDIVKKERWLVLNKIDLINDIDSVKNTIIKKLNWADKVFCISAINGVGCKELTYEIMKHIELEKNNYEKI